MKHYFSLLLILTLSIHGYCQSVDLNSPLPEDSSIIKGVLSNGMTYYIKSTDVVKDAASYYIIQNVGSILEEEDQQGLAHFLEHMAFNGTKTFPGKAMLNTLQEYGAVFGKDINAYTSFDETVYNINNIPTKEGMVDTSLAILKDWSNYLLLTDEEIDAERGVIKEEWRTGQNGQKRMYEAAMPTKFNYSKYAERLPIGLMSVVEGFNYKSLRDFYHDWYRTDLQAIAIIGDVNAEEIEQKIKANFSEIPAIKNPKPRDLINIPDNNKMLYSYSTDPEVSAAAITFGIRHVNPTRLQTVGDLKNYLLESMAVNMLSARISEKTQLPESSYLSARIGYGPLVRTANVFSINMSPKPNKQKQTFTDILTEVNRAVKYGYTQSEIDRTITLVKTSYKNQIANKKNRSHKSIQSTIQDNYLNNAKITDIETEYALSNQILDNIRPEQLHEAIKKLYSKNNRVLNVVGVEGQDNLTESQAAQIIQFVEDEAKINPYTETVGDSSIVSNFVIKPGTIINKTVDKEVLATTYLLSNNVKVHYKYVNKQNDRVALKAISYGGKSKLKDEDLASASILTSLVSMSGLVDFTATDLKKFLTGKTAGVKLSLGDITESMSGGSNTKDLETMLQLVHAYFVKPRFDENAFKVIENNINNYLVNRGKDVGERIKDSLTYAVYGPNNPKRHILDKAYADAISFDKIQAIYHDRFDDASDFEFFIVGDIKEDQLEPLLKQLIASIPTDNKSETFDTGKQANWISETIDRDIYIDMADPKAKINIAYKLDMPYSNKHAIHTHALGDLLQLRVTETVRESEGGAYSPRAQASFSREPISQAMVSFNFDCNPDKADQLVDIVNNEFEKIAKGIINESDLNNIKSNYFKEREQSKNNNGYDMRAIIRYFRYHENMNDPKTFEDIINTMSKKDIQNIAKKIISNGDNYEIIFKPKK